jgi:GntR family transcriptional regulator, transcriptional repressor for pyruvate dehydrogenase complex
MQSLLNYKPVEKTTTAGAVEKQLRTDILTGRIAVGSKLPPERELALALGVNRLTLRSALARLASAGLIVSQQGDGNRVLDYRVSCGLERLPDLAEAFENDAATLEKLVVDLLALRRMISAEAAALATARFTTEHARVLTGLIEKQWTRTGNLEKFLEGDLEFSRAILAIADNMAFQLAFNTVVQFAKEHGELLQLMFAPPENHCRGYEGLIGLLETGNPALVREAIREVLETLDAEFLGRISAYLAQTRPPQAKR